METGDLQKDFSFFFPKIQDVSQKKKCVQKNMCAKKKSKKICVLTGDISVAVLRAV
jgi:hypothetical protein